MPVTNRDFNVESNYLTDQLQTVMSRNVRRWIDTVLERESAAELDAYQARASELSVNEGNRLNDRQRHMVTHYLVWNHQ